MEKTLNFLCLLGDWQGEKRPDIQLNSFGFYTNGSLEVDLSLLRLGLQETKEKTPLVRGLGRFPGGRRGAQCPGPPSASPDSHPGLPQPRFLQSE